MNRINPEQIAQFFKIHPGMEPVQHSFVVHEGVEKEEDGDIIGCCGLTAGILGDALLNDQVEATSNLGEFGCDDYARILGLDIAYTTGFTLGWDQMDIRNLDITSDEFKNGYSDGLLAYETTMEILDQ